MDEGILVKTFQQHIDFSADGLNWAWFWRWLFVVAQVFVEKMFGIGLESVFVDLSVQEGGECFNFVACVAD